MLHYEEFIPNVNHFDHLTSDCFEMVLRRLGKKDLLSTNFEREVLYSGCSTLEKETSFTTITALYEVTQFP